MINIKQKIVMKENNEKKALRLGDLAFVYAKVKWMRTVKAFNLDGFFAGNLIFASMIEDCDDNHRKLQALADGEKTKLLQFQLRRNGKVLFQTT